ncbi:hypothetical protein KXX25_006069 [Aspergillus fumigatus]|nr:hypothetical protein KXX61_003910 [Aspergillus fumigatus]KAH1713517.1 hypothetical protein KXX25_006069 [Aspergillus fumigatus]KAH1841330.1 hypothetical protein KXX55_004182 [Aspergillus fumigatus]KAH2530485.1 hypothetical protein KXW12_005926 [Aspergillus fumigatus]
MRFPMNQHRLELKSAQEARERERELAKEIQEGDIDDEDAGALPLPTENGSQAGLLQSESCYAIFLPGRV